MNKIKYVWLVAIISIVSLLVWIYKSPEELSKKEIIKIGIILPMTGELAPFGKKIENGIRLATDEYNAVNKSHIELIIEDDKGENTATVSALEKIVNTDKAKIIIGTLTSGGTLAIAPLAQNNGVFLLSPSASNPKLSDAGSLIYRIWSSDNLDGVVAAEYCFYKLKLRKMAISYQNNDYCFGLKEVFKNRFKELGGEIFIESGYNQGENNFKTLIEKIKQGYCEGVYLPGHPYGIASFLRQSKELGLMAKFISNVAVEDNSFIGSAGNASEDLYYTAPAFDIKNKNLNTFVGDYKKKYGVDPDIFSVKGYESISIIAQAISSGASYPYEISKYIDSVKKFNLLEGEVIFSNNGDVILPVSIKQYKNSKSIVIDTINPKSK